MYTKTNINVNIFVSKIVLAVIWEQKPALSLAIIFVNGYVNSVKCTNERTCQLDSKLSLAKQLTLECHPLKMIKLKNKH